MANPWDSDPIVSSGPIYGPPRLPSPQTPAQASQDQLQVQHLQQQIDQTPLQNENTRVNIAQGQTSIQNQHFNQNQGLRQEFNNLPEVKNYSVALQSLGTALKAPDTPQGDLAIIYAYAKAADPGSVVREGEMDMATATASLPQKYQADLARLTQGKRLPPEVRTGLIETMRQSVAGMRQVYDQQRTRYGDVAKQNGIDPQQVLGDPLYDAYRPLEENYIRAHGGTPRDPNAPQQPIDPSGSGDIGFNTPHPDPKVMTPEQANAYDAFLRANPKATPDQLNSFIHSIGLPGTIANAKDVLDAGPKAGFQPGSSAVFQKPDITDVRGGNNTAGQDRINATVRGVLDVPTMGTLDKVIAATDTIAKGGTFDQNLARQYAISDYDQQNHPGFRLGGQALGGMLLPMGAENTLLSLSAKGGAYGGGYGLGSSRSLSDVPANVLAGAATGAAVPAVLGKVFKPKGGAIDPLVDPVTGELNKPMVTDMTPAQRTAVMKDYGMQTISPGMAGGRTARVVEQGFYNAPGSAGMMEDFYAPASRELRRSMQGVAQQFGTSKTLAEGGAELQRGANEYIDRGKAVIGKAYDAIPISDKAPASTSNAVATLQQLTGRFESNPDLAASLKDPKLATYQEALQKGGLTWKDLKDFRSIIGEKIGDMRFGEGSRTSDLRALYASLSEDMQQTAAAMGPKASAAFNRANNLNRQQQQLIEGSLTRILGKDGMLSPEKAAGAVQTMTQGGKVGGDLRALAQVKAATVKSGAWDEIAATLIHLGGQPAKSEGRDFSPETFVNWYADMSEPARAMLFKPELRKSLDGFVAMNQQLALLRGMKNTSNTTPTLVGTGFATGLGGTIAAGFVNPAAWLGTLGMVGGATANLGMAKLWTTPGFVKLMTGLGRASMTGNENAVRSQVGRLAKFAATNPEFSEPVQSILRQISNDNFVGPLAADPNQKHNQQ